MLSFRPSGPRPDVDACVRADSPSRGYFQSVKTGRVFEYRSRHQIALMIHLESDAKVISYELLDPAAVLGRYGRSATRLTSVAILRFHHVSGCYAIAIHTSESWLPRDTLTTLQQLESVLAEQGCWLLRQERQWLYREPRWTTVQAICASRFATMPYDCRLNLLRRINTEGSLSLRECVDSENGQTSVESVLALAVHSEVSIDLESPLTYNTTVRSMPNVYGSFPDRLP